MLAGAVMLWTTPTVRDAESLAKGKDENHPPGVTPLDLAVRPDMPAAIQERIRKGQQAWPTPRSEDSKQTGAHRGEADTLTSKARQDWFTPQGRDWKDTGPSQGNRKDVNPGVQAHRQSWTTPTVDDAGGRTTKYQQGGTSLSCQCAGLHAPASRSMSGKVFGSSTEPAAALNPMFVEALMGLPSGWTELQDKQPYPML